MILLGVDEFLTSNMRLDAMAGEWWNDGIE